MVLLSIEYQCDLNQAADKCSPQLSFTRLDDPNNASASHGFNFRYVARNRQGNAPESRDLYKVAPASLA